MARSPTHTFGQEIGNLFQEAVEPVLQAFANEHGLFLDKKGPRPARGTRKLVRWRDRSGNEHDLDFVLEEGGTPDTIGTPRAFIEAAYRRYTKHSRNKAQEIQGAVLPVRDMHGDAAPFIGAILAGVFTEDALEQMRSLGFCVLYFPWETVVAAFGTVGVDVHFEEDTLDAEVEEKLRDWRAVPDTERALVAEALIQTNGPEVRRFMAALERAVTRRIQIVRVLPLHGTPAELPSVADAIDFIQDYDEALPGVKVVAKYEVEIRYSNGDRVQGQFTSKETAIHFLRAYPRN